MTTAPKASAPYWPHISVEPSARYAQNNCQRINLVGRTIFTFRCEMRSRKFDASTAPVACNCIEHSNRLDFMAAVIRNNSFEDNNELGPECFPEPFGGCLHGWQIKMRPFVWASERLESLDIWLAAVKRRFPYAPFDDSCEHATVARGVDKLPEVKGGSPAKANNIQRSITLSFHLSFSNILNGKSK